LAIPLVLLLTNTFRLFGFPILRFRLYLMMFIPETCFAHLIYIYILGHTKLISCSSDNWDERAKFLFLFFFSQKLNFWKEQILSEASDTYCFLDNVVWIYIIVQTASVQCTRLHLLWLGCLLYICNSRRTLVLFYWWIGNRVKLNRLCVSYCFNIWFFFVKCCFNLIFWWVRKNTLIC
jgi:hypothetical protein